MCGRQWTWNGPIILIYSSLLLMQDDRSPPCWPDFTHCHQWRIIWNGNRIGMNRDTLGRINQRAKLPLPVFIIVCCNLQLRSRQSRRTIQFYGRVLIIFRFLSAEIIKCVCWKSISIAFAFELEPIIWTCNRSNDTQPHGAVCIVRRGRRRN